MSDEEQAEAIRKAQAQPGIAKHVAAMAGSCRTGKSELDDRLLTDIAELRELVEAIAGSVVTHAARIEDLRRRVEALEARAGPDF